MVDHPLAALERYGASPVFDETSVPAKLLSEHKTKPGVWGNLRVLSGRLRYVIDDGTSASTIISRDESSVVRPGQIHHVEMMGPVRFQIDFYRAVGDVKAQA